MKKLLACLLLLFFMAGVSSGCWSRKELNELAIVLGAGVDRTPDAQVRLTLQLAKPSASAGGSAGGAVGTEPPTWVVSGTGETVLDAQRKLANRISRHIYWAHNVILVFGEEAARCGIRRYMDFFSRAPQPRETIWVMVAKGEAKDILETYSELEKTSAQDIGYLARAKTGYSVNLKDFLIMLATKGSNPIASRVDVVERGVTLGGLVPGKPVQQKGAALTGTAVFRGETLAGWLDESETRGLLWLRGKVLKGIISVPSLTEPGKEMSIDIIRGHTEAQPQYDGESVWFNVKIVVEGDLLEQQSGEEIMEREVREAVEKEMAGEVEEKARLTLEKAQREYGVDIFDFGAAFHRKYPKAWAELKDRWDEVFAGAGVNFTVEAHLRRSGLEAGKTSEKE
ncbi:MAG: Spore germination protein B3 precursor [Pelotomaculum sp. PtaB.Bin013]|uniref:Ger(X)C family spore germination protein n=1 Tax=Pelotomaculum isophthalicicum JI TaxID=947010 RepID=A0A9X4H5E1_9FIRM|nr:Ger(x)C family spore germination protein [Pelotomaculum isophthalicicum]MDF9408402.1 Ger(x)C family spore germination protein [Pelotomaculum isophthalicicum JI]OPX87889.1 MAG: Spore germination protein B3 precursor [Pelotomaculum sp. PtaB.Bin013]